MNFFIGDWMLWRNSKGVATKFWLGGRIHRHPNPPTPKFSFSSNFGHFILKMLENAKNFKKKVTEISKFLGGRHPRFFLSAGVLTPATPVGDASA